MKMPFPKPVPSLSEEEFEHFLQKLEEFEAPEETEENIKKHREALQNAPD